MTTAILSPLLRQKFFGNDGKPLVGGKLFVYNAGTSIKTDSYTDSSGITPNANPVILDFRGETSVWTLPNLAYKFVLAPSTDTDPPTNPIWSVDQVTTQQLITLYGGVDVGISNQYVLNFTASFTQLQDGIVIYWIPSNTNTGPSTINVNGLGPVPLTNQDGSAITAGQLLANQIAQILFKGTGFVVLSALTTISTGSFLATFSGFTGAQSANVIFSRLGSIVTLVTNITISGTSNAITMRLSGLPIALQPPSDRSVLCSNLLDNGIPDRFGKALVVPAGSVSAGDITFYLWTGTQFDLSGFTASGAKGLILGWTLSYSL